jgi:predicted O-linked N-acetylglucosamine transferase (SPINDLY family)
MALRTPRPGSLSYLWLLEMDGEVSVAKWSLRAEAAALGLLEDRLCFAKPVPKPEHLGRMALADVFVDSAEYSAHTIAADPL